LSYSLDDLIIPRKYEQADVVDENVEEVE